MARTGRRLPEARTNWRKSSRIIPPNISVPLPSWQYVTQTGDISAKPVEDAINEYAGDCLSSIPFFDSTCDADPDKQPSSATVRSANVGGSGQNQWYHISKFLSFQLDDPKGAFVNGNNSAACAVANAKECLKGSFVTFITEGTVWGGPCDLRDWLPRWHAVSSVQLIK